MIASDIKPRNLVHHQTYDEFAIHTQNVDFDVEDLVDYVINQTDVFYWINLESVWGKIGFVWDEKDVRGHFQSSEIPFRYIPSIPDGERIKDLNNIFAQLDRTKYNSLDNRLVLLQSNWENITNIGCPLGASRIQYIEYNLDGIKCTVDMELGTHYRYLDHHIVINGDMNNCTFFDNDGYDIHLYGNYSNINLKLSNFISYTNVRCNLHFNGEYFNMYDKINSIKGVDNGGKNPKFVCCINDDDYIHDYTIKYIPIDELIRIYIYSESSYNKITHILSWKNGQSIDWSNLYIYDANNRNHIIKYNEDLNITTLRTLCINPCRNILGIDEFDGLNDYNWGSNTKFDIIDSLNLSDIRFNYNVSIDRESELAHKEYTYKNVNTVGNLQIQYTSSANFKSKGIIINLENVNNFISSKDTTGLHLGVIQLKTELKKIYVIANTSNYLAYTRIVPNIRLYNGNNIVSDYGLHILLNEYIDINSNHKDEIELINLTVDNDNHCFIQLTRGIINQFDSDNRMQEVNIKLENYYNVINIDFSDEIINLNTIKIDCFGFIIISNNASAHYLRQSTYIRAYIYNSSIDITNNPNINADDLNTLLINAYHGTSKTITIQQPKYNLLTEETIQHCIDEGYTFNIKV